MVENYFKLNTKNIHNSTLVINIFQMISIEK